MATNNLPEKTTDAEIDDYQSVELDLESLFNRFILPIDRVRSFGSPTITDRTVSKDADDQTVNEVANTADYDPSKPQESRAHAFYRMIGFPVINSNSEYYNPGFDPTLKSNERTKRSQIASKISPVVKRSHALRESTARARLAYFRFQGTDAAIFALAMGVPNGTKPFLQMDPTEGFDSNNQFDPQQYSMPTRRLFIEKKYKRSDNESITNYFETGFHILRPFNVDQNIVDTITGFSNETRQVAAPFLKNKKDTIIERDLAAKRPAIELVLRLRLRQQNIDSSADIAFQLDQFIDADINQTDLKSIVSTLLNQTGITDEDILKRFKTSSSLEIINLNNLVKTIKGVLTMYINSVNEITDSIAKEIRWTPMPGVNGPEEGSDITNIITPLQKTELEKRIVNLSIRAQESVRQGTLSDNPDIISSDFFLSQYENVDKTFDNDLNIAKEERDNYQRKGSNALSAIEIITGEVSGLGLMDILAIYTSLWAVDINVLISMLDEIAFNNLYVNNVDLRTQAVEDRRVSGPKMGISEAMQLFERQVISILSYCDRVFQQKRGSPTNSEGGAAPLVRE